MKKMKELTRAEEQIMQVLWDLEKAFVKEIRDKLPEPKPAYNTVSTIVRILQDKGFVSHEAFGKSHRYFPLVDKETYTHKFMRNFVGNYFDNSFSRMISFFAKKEDINLQELEEILQNIKEHSQD
nr:BlaI/MecI/CopY family transcriptional regulator [Odoribacter laneus]